MKNFLSIDFESWAYPNLPEFVNLQSLERKKIDNGFVKESAEKILTLLAKYKTKLTFFCLGELFEWYPEVITLIEKEGHEIAYHSHRHDVLYSKQVLLKTLDNSKEFISRFRPKGFRAPEILMKREYLKTLADNGFIYDSSVYGSFGNRKQTEGIKEFPISTYSLTGQVKKLEFPRTVSFPMLFSDPPIGSGFMIAALGNSIGKFFRRLNRKGQPVVAFMHNWQIVKPKNARFPSRSYIATHPLYLPYLRDCYKIFEYLLENFEFARMDSLLGGSKHEEA